MDNRRLDPSAPRVVFRLWSDYFLDMPEIDDDDELFDDEEKPNHGLIAVHAVPGPFQGHVPDVNKLFKFYVCSTNFKITDPMFKSLDREVEGIETLCKISPYKLRIGIGELFDEVKVRRDISMVLKEWLNKQNSMQ